MLSTFAFLALMQATAAQTPAPTPARPAAPTCTGDAFAAFDFWVGEWDVYPNGGDTKVAESRIERLYTGCAIRENWMPLNNRGGGSLSGYNPQTKRWHQTWIGSSPGQVTFEGGPVDGGMVLVGYWANLGGPGRDGKVRMTYTMRDDGAVRQYGQMSFDHGATCVDSFDFIYRPKSPAEGDSQ